MARENDIVLDAKHLIRMFNNESLHVSNLQIQKLMYFFEGYYMNVKDCNEIYECPFVAWNYGPVSIPLNKKFTSFGKDSIVIEDKLDEISQEKQEALKVFFEEFKNYTPWELVRITHLEDSPWYNVWTKNGNRVVAGKNGEISKIETKEWFKELFLNDAK